MSKATRKKIIAGNWKMNMTPSQARDLINMLKPACDTAESDVVFCVPYVDIPVALDMLKGSKISVGAQNVHCRDNGAYTGEISAPMLKELGVKYVIIGHSERRQFFAEADALVNMKIKKAMEHGLIPIVCVGETLEQRKQGITIDFVRTQTKIALMGIAPDDAKQIVIAYEPIWAIGTGENAKPEQAEEVCRAIRQVIGEMYDTNVAANMRIQYGGSVTAATAAELFNQPNIDGGLVGGASLKADFAEIVNYS
ncbi:MAG: triose-phosphate isomerase [Clostridiales bacterium]|jgi:triosephosphate isomerase|nr:triose-phosphate isomerase [Clostridiales bacterium]